MSNSGGLGLGRAYVRSCHLWLGLVVASLLLVSCGDGSGGNLPEPTRTPELPSATTEPSPTDSPVAPETSDSPDDPDPSSDSPAASPTRTRTPRPTATVTESPQENESSPAASTSEDESESDTSDEPDDVPAWVWVLLALVVIGAAVAIVLVVRKGRRRGAWTADFTAATDEVAWCSQTLLPQLLAADSLQLVAGGWVVGESRVAAVEDRLTTLEATARDDTDRMRARALRDAVRAARQDVQRLVAPGVGVVPTGDLMAVGIRLEDARAAARLGMP